MCMCVHAYTCIYMDTHTHTHIHVRVCTNFFPKIKTGGDQAIFFLIALKGSI